MSVVQYSYETIGSSSYLVATFPNGQGIVNYQLQMLANNEIKNVAKVSKRQQNDDILVSYNITSTIPLSELDSKNKISKIGLIHIIEGAIAALDDAAEYQLNGSGMVFEEDYIFVKPGTYEPHFIYLPCNVEDRGVEPLKNFLLSLVISSKVEMTQDNFVQVLLETLNKPALVLNDIRKLCEKLKNGAPTKQEKPKVSAQPAPAVRQAPPVQEMPAPQPVVVPTAVQETAPVRPERRAPETPPVAAPRAKEEKTPKAQKKAPEKASDKNPKKTLFLVLQVVLVAVLAALVFSGVLADENGALIVEYVGGVVLALGALDFIVYREMFTNNKKTAEKAEKKKPAKSAPAKAPATPKVAVPGKETSVAHKSAVAVPGKEQPAVSREPVKPAEPKPAEEPAQQPTCVIPEPIIPVQSVPINNTPISDFESEDTVVMADDSAQGGYLELYENGLATRFSLTKEYTVIGKLRGQCDFVINNNKISKMHAEFISRGGQYFVKDYNSTNGTYINGAAQRIQSNTEYPIFNGDRITLADVDLTFKC